MISAGNGKQLRGVVSSIVLLLWLAACTSDGVAPIHPDFTTPSAETQAETSIGLERRDHAYDPLDLGLGSFDRGQYGLAERYLRQAVERSPANATAWVALAACYDELRRFDLADNAYRRAIGLVGETTQILNNMGYSYTLRGRFTQARQKLRQALRREPDNPMILNNLKLLEANSPAEGRPGP